MLLLPATVTAQEAVAVQRQLTQALGQVSEPVVVIDASGLQRFDSAALAVLLACERLAVAAGKRFIVRGLPTKLTSLAELYGVDSLLPSDATTGTLAAASRAAA